MIIAVSGGPDSLALAALAKSFSYEHKTKIYYVLINHNIRKNSGKEALQVKNLLKTKKIKLKIFTNRKKIKKNIQNEARLIRYTKLQEYCSKQKAKVILTAHNLEDQVETFLIRLSRGSGLKGLSAMKTLSSFNNKAKIYRPLLDVKKNQLIKISRLVFGKYIKDPSNYNSKYLRTNIRKLKKPLEQSGINYDQIIRSINNLASSSSTLESYFKKTFKEIVRKRKNLLLINTTKFNCLNNETKMTLINNSIRTLKGNYYNLRSKKVMNLINNLSNRNFSRSTLGGCLFIKKPGYLTLKLEKK